MKNVYIIGLLIFTIISCQEKEEVVEISRSGEELSVSITDSAGDRWDQTDDFLPLPVNIGKAGPHQQVLIISDRIKEGKKLEVNPIGAIKVVEGDSLTTYLIGLPIDTKYQTIKSEDLDEFATIYSGAKWIIEQYLVNRKGTNRVRLRSWEGRKSAIKYLLKEPK